MKIRNIITSTVIATGLLSGFIGEANANNDLKTDTNLKNQSLFYNQLFNSGNSNKSNSKLTLQQQTYENLVKNKRKKLILDTNSKNKNIALTDAKNKGIKPGIGFSSDTQSLTTSVCYNPSTITKTGQSAIVALYSAVDVKTLADNFDSSANLKADIGFFTTDDTIKYITELKNNSFSMSMNYYVKIANTVNMTYVYTPDRILSDDGKAVYDNGQNPFFRLQCGDRLINSYEEGAGLLMSAQVNFDDETQKKTFEANFNAGITGFTSIIAHISEVVDKYHLHGTVRVDAKQIGGDPTQLAKILASNASPCNLNNKDEIEKCKLIAKSLSEYGSTFATQFEKDKNGIWDSPLVPMGIFEKGWRVSDIGVKLAPSYVTDEVIQARTELADRYKYDSYYAQHLDKLLNHYPVPLDADYRKKVQAVSDNAVGNTNLFVYNPKNDSSAIDCWDFPYRCAETKNALLTNLLSVEKTDIQTNIADPITKNYYTTEPMPRATIYANGGKAGYGQPELGKFQVVPEVSTDGSIYITDVGIASGMYNRGYQFELRGTYMMPSNGCTSGYYIETMLNRAPYVNVFSGFFRDNIGAWICGDEMRSGDPVTDRLIIIKPHQNPYYFDAI
jgi:hypothetical protein